MDQDVPAKGRQSTLFEERVNEIYPRALIPFSLPLEDATVPTEQLVLEAARELCRLAEGA
jgi:hypothetical protein